MPSSKWRGRFVLALTFHQRQPPTSPPWRPEIEPPWNEMIVVECLLPREILPFGLHSLPRNGMRFLQRFKGGPDDNDVLVAEATRKEDR